MTRLEGAGESEDGPITRRRLLGAAGAGTALVAGCLGGGTEEDSGVEGHSDDAAADGGENRYGESLVDHPGDEPIAFVDGQQCPVCRMTPASYGGWHCQLAHENGEGAVFDTPGCLFAYYAYQPVEAPVTAGWVMGIEAGDLIDATEAHYVLVTDKRATADEPMGPNPRPFADREDAVAYLEDWDAEELTEDDVISLSDVGQEHAEIYRGNRLP
ncbi:nitrous oxide reductase accessory protein NosL [Halopiger aswanensis]|uniref:Nitrous oxide reductase accessory protein NosL n=1 Tax=Halopiger aswanensis TaxID=148449 RepID=A0A419WQ34_9EURY|nr:nitrous oxide reductase accessory protein NosL [Halopiger aswanensis]RKD97590.1 nitrous oxide reductase accessory protein NosL [Halopiger aswanensis]